MSFSWWKDMRGSGRGRGRLGRKISQNDGRQENVYEGDFEKEHPAEPHELVVAKTGERPAHPDEDEEKRDHLREKDKDVYQSPAPTVRTVGNARKMPAAEKERHDNGAAGDHGDVFPKEKEAELHRAVFGVVAANQFGLGFGKIEGKAIGFGEDGDCEHDERDEHRNGEE